MEKKKIQNWFKYQRQKDFKTEKKMIKSYKVLKHLIFSPIFFKSPIENLHVKTKRFSNFASERVMF